MRFEGRTLWECIVKSQVRKDPEKQPPQEDACSDQHDAAVTPVVQYRTWAPVHVPAALFLLRLPVYGPGKQWDIAHVLGPLHPHSKPGKSCCGQSTCDLMGYELLVGKSLSETCLLFSIILPCQ